jgi:hypothetical protein
MRRTAWIFGALGAGCAGPTSAVWRGTSGGGHDVVAVAEPQFLVDRVDFGGPTDPLWRGVYVGDVVFSGGFEVEEIDGAMQNRSTQVELGSQERYRADTLAWTRECLGGALGVEGRDFVWTDAPAEVPTPERRNLRGSSSSDGHDNQALPLFHLAPRSLPSPITVPAGADVLLVPFVVHSYSHNGGWFLGQTYGSASGARLRWFVVAYDATGTPVGHVDVEARTETPGLFSPNSSQVEDHRIEVEKHGCDELVKRVRRI